MLRYCLIFLLSWLGLNAYSQAVTRTTFAGYGLIGVVNSSAVINGGDHQLKMTFTDLRGRYSVDSVQVGDYIWDTKCDRYTIVYINARTPFLDVEVTTQNIGSGAPQQGGGNAAIYRPTPNYNYPTDIQGINETVRNCILMHQILEIDTDLAAVAVGNGVDSISYIQDTILVLYANGVEITRDTQSLPVINLNTTVITNKTLDGDGSLGDPLLNNWNMPINLNSSGATTYATVYNVDAITNLLLPSYLTPNVDHGDIRVYSNSSTSGELNLIADNGFTIGGIDTSLFVGVNQTYIIQLDTLLTQWRILSTTTMSANGMFDIANQSGTFEVDTVTLASTGLFINGESGAVEFDTLSYYRLTVANPTRISNVVNSALGLTMNTVKDTLSQAISIGGAGISQMINQKNGRIVSLVINNTDFAELLATDGINTTSIKVEQGGIRLNTPAINAATATTGQVPTLQSDGTIEYEDAGGNIGYNITDGVGIIPISPIQTNTSVGINITVAATSSTFLDIPAPSADNVGKVIIVRVKDAHVTHNAFVVTSGGMQMVTPGGLNIDSQLIPNNETYSFVSTEVMAGVFQWVIIREAALTDGDKTDVNISSNGGVMIVEGFQSRPLSAAFPDVGQVYQWTGSEWAPADLPSGADGNGIYSGSGTIPSIGGDEDFLVQTNGGETFAIGNCVGCVGFEDFQDTYAPGSKFEGFYSSTDYWGDVGIMSTSPDSNRYAVVAVGPHYVQLETKRGIRKAGLQLETQPAGDDQGNGAKFYGFDYLGNPYSYLMPREQPTNTLGDTSILIWTGNTDNFADPKFIPYSTAGGGGGAADGVVTAGSVVGSDIVLNRSIGGDVTIDASSLGGGGGVATVVAGTGISVNATDPANPVVTNTAPDQTVSITGAGSVAVTGTYPNFTATGSGLTGTLTENYIPVADATGNLENSTLTETSGIVYAPKLAQTGTGNNRPSLSMASGFNTSTTGAVLFDTGIPWAGAIGTVTLVFGYHANTSNFYFQSAGSIKISVFTYSGTGAYFHASVYGDPPLSETMQVVTTPGGTLGVVYGLVTDTRPTSGYNFFLEDVRFSDSSKIPLFNPTYSTLTDLAGYATRVSIGSINKTKTIPWILSRTGAANTPNNVLSLGSGGTVDGEVGVNFNSYSGGSSDPTTAPNGSWTLTSIRQGAGQPDFIFRQNSAERFRMTSGGFFGIGTAAPAYPLDINSTGAVRIPVGTDGQDPIGTAGLWRFTTTKGAYRGHNGTSFGDVYLASNTPTNGQIPIFNSTTGMNVYTTPAYLTAEVDGSTTNEGALTVGAGGANTSTIVSNTSGSTPVTIAGGTNVTVTEAGSTITIAAAGGGGGDPIYTGTLTGGISITIALYGFAPVYSTSGGVVTAANTTLNTTLHQYYVQGTTGNIVLLGAGTKQVTATFAYTAGTTYYLNDAGGLSTSADNDGDAIDYDSAVVYCIASLGANSYLINLKEPRHFVNN